LLLIHTPFLFRLISLLLKSYYLRNRTPPSVWPSTWWVRLGVGTLVAIVMFNVGQIIAAGTVGGIVKSEVSAGPGGWDRRKMESTEARIFKSALAWYTFVSPTLSMGSWLKWLC
jgi:hypothetical protein